MTFSDLNAWKVLRSKTCSNSLGTDTSNHVVLDEPKKSRVLWVAPILNHYKSRFLDRLAERSDFVITVLAGTSPRSLGHRLPCEASGFQTMRVNATMGTFALNPAVYYHLMKAILSSHPDVLFMPAEKKYIPIIAFLSILKKLFHFRFISYCHPLVGQNNRRRRINILWTRLIFSRFDRIVFYTEEACKWAVRNSILPGHKAYFANNTLDTATIWSHYCFEINISDPKTILFIGRLIENKQIHTLFDYFRRLKQRLPEVQLIVIGDGPEGAHVEDFIRNERGVIWRGALVDEQAIARDMKSAHVVFVPGATGLSIVHAFAYGKPYITLSGSKHGPELSYLIDGINGMLLRGPVDQDIDRIVHMLRDPIVYSSFCVNAFKTAQRVSIDVWCQQMKTAISVVY